MTDISNYTTYRIKLPVNRATDLRYTRLNLENFLIDQYIDKIIFFPSLNVILLDIPEIPSDFNEKVQAYCTAKNENFTLQYIETEGHNLSSGETEWLEARLAERQQNYSNSNQNNKVYPESLPLISMSLEYSPI